MMPKATLLRPPYKTVYYEAKKDKNLMVNANNAQFVPIIDAGMQSDNCE